MRQRFKYGDRAFRVDLLSGDPPRVLLVEGDETLELTPSIDLGESRGRIPWNGVTLPYFVTADAKGVWVTLAGHSFYLEKIKSRRAAQEDHVGFAAPMPGKVIQVAVEQGARVERGQVLVILEAMKMEHRIEAPANGRVTVLHCKEGELVDLGFHLLEFEAGEESEAKEN